MKGIHPRRVLMTADTVGGVWTYAIDLARELDRAGAQVVIATMSPRPSDAQRDQVRELRHAVLHDSRFKLEWMDDAWDDVAAAGEWLLSLEARYQPEVVHLNGFVHGSLGWLSPRIVVAHSCVCSWWQAVHGRPAPAAYDRYRAAVRAGLGEADLVIAPTVAMRDAAALHYGPLRRTAVIGNGRTRDGLEPAEKQPFVLGAGRAWDAGKNLAALDRAAAAVRWPVCIAGDLVAPDGRIVSLRAARALGVVAPAALARAMGQAAIYALPARYEPFGLSVLEAAFCGCALVLGDIDTLRELWTGAALFVDPDDDEGLAETLQWLIDHPDVRAELSAQARARAADRTSAVMAAAYLESYRRVSASIAA